MKRFVKSIFIAVFAVTVAASLTGCVETDKKYFETVGNYSFWDNAKEESVAQYKFYDAVDRFLSEGSLTNGNAVGSDGKIRKVFYLGWDGTRADALTNIFYDENSFETNGYNHEVREFSGLHKLKSQGGLYLAYAGGEKGKDSEQQSSTCAGWTSQLTGGWNTLHGVDTNNDVKRKEVDTFVMKYAKLGLSTGLAFDWGQLFDLTLKEEVRYALQNPTLPVTYCDIDRLAASSVQDIVKNENLKKEKDVLAESLELYNKVSCDTISPQADYDVAMRDYLSKRIELGDDIVAGIFHRPDTNGHTDGFSNENPAYVNSVRNANIYLYQLLLQIEEREKTANEEWLVIVTTDHGGSGKGHGEQVYEHRTTWVASNRDLAKYYGSNYDGFREN